MRPEVAVPQGAGAASVDQGPPPRAVRHYIDAASHVVASGRMHRVFDDRWHDIHMPILTQLLRQ